MFWIVHNKKELQVCDLPKVCALENTQKPASKALRAVNFVLAFVSKHAPGVCRMMHAPSDSGHWYLQRKKADDRFIFSPTFAAIETESFWKNKKQRQIWQQTSHSRTTFLTAKIKYRIAWCSSTDFLFLDWISLPGLLVVTCLWFETERESSFLQEHF